MGLRVLYLENRAKHWKVLKNAIDQINEERNPAGRIEIEWAKSPDELPGEVENLRYDVILADVYFDDPETGTEDGKDRLSEVLDTVQRWSEKTPLSRSVPVIAYTGMGNAVLQQCLTHKDRLYDIWDKNTAKPAYVAWRLSKLEAELSRQRPDAMLQRLILSMEEGASWHQNVCDMVRRYDSGWTERDQIERSTAAILNIAFRMDLRPEVTDLWKSLSHWELFSRALTHRTRGHARHVINVFWLGYYLMNYPRLRPIFCEIWRGVLAARPGMESVKDFPPAESLSSAWYLASLLHDSAICLEKALPLVHRHSELVKTFTSADLKIPGKGWLGSVKAKRQHIREAFEAPLATFIEKNFFVSGTEVDHGAAVAAELLSRTLEHKWFPVVREACRAMALHNLLPKQEGVDLTWGSDPISCLLLFCDQLQTWDRERNDEALADDDEPRRAELVNLSVSGSKKRPLISIWIDYIAPEHVQRSPLHFERMRDRLEAVLQEKPAGALMKISKPWPFEFKVRLSLSRVPLDTAIELGN